MNTVKIEVNGLDITALADKIDNLTNALSNQNRPEPIALNSEKLITRTETAQMLGVTLPTIYDWTKKRIITAYRIGNRVRYKHSEIMQTVTNNKTHY
jgi:excisionase family DNA binding protein